MKMKLSDGSTYELSNVRNDCCRDEGGSRLINGPSLVLFTIDPTGQNITSLISELKEKFNNSENLKNIKVTCESLTNTTTFNFNKIENILMTMNSVHMAVEVRLVP